MANDLSFAGAVEVFARRLHAIADDIPTFARGATAFESPNPHADVAAHIITVVAELVANHTATLVGAAARADAESRPKES